MMRTFRFNPLPLLLLLLLTAGSAAAQSGSAGAGFTMRVSVPEVLRLRLDDATSSDRATIPIRVDVASGVARIDPAGTVIEVFSNTDWQLGLAVETSDGLELELPFRRDLPVVQELEHQRQRDVGAAADLHPQPLVVQDHLSGAEDLGGHALAHEQPRRRRCAVGLEADLVLQDGRRVRGHPHGDGDGPRLPGDEPYGGGLPQDVPPQPALDTRLDPARLVGGHSEHQGDVLARSHEAVGRRDDGDLRERGGGHEEQEEDERTMHGRVRA